MNIKLNLSPVRLDSPTEISVRSTTLVLNGVEYDLSELPDGATARHPDLGVVTRNGNSYNCTVILGHGPNAPLETRFPDSIFLENHDGKVDLPPYDLTLDELEEVSPQ